MNINLLIKKLRENFMAYRTEDYYEIDDVELRDDFDALYQKASEEHGIDFLFPLDEVKSMLPGSLTAYSTYGGYTKFLFILHKIIGEYTAEITFSPDPDEIGYSQTTEIYFAVNDSGKATFSLYNGIIPDEETVEGVPITEGSEEYAPYLEAVKQGLIMFTSDKNLELDLSSISMEEFVNKLES